MVKYPNFDKLTETYTEQRQNEREIEHQIPKLLNWKPYKWYWHVGIWEEMKVNTWGNTIK